MEIYDMEMLVCLAAAVLAMIVILIGLSIKRSLDRLKKSIDATTEQVQAYLDCVIQEEVEQEEDKSLDYEETERAERVERENSAIISSVLQEIFP